MGMMEGFALRYCSPRMLSGEGDLLLCGEKVAEQTGRSRGGHYRSSTRGRGAGGLEEGVLTHEQLAVSRTYRVTLCPWACTHLCSCLKYFSLPLNPVTSSPHCSGLKYSLCLVKRLCRAPPHTLSLTYCSWASWSVFPIGQRPPCKPSFMRGIVEKCSRTVVGWVQRSVGDAEDEASMAFLLGLVIWRRRMHTNRCTQWTDGHTTTWAGGVPALHILRTCRVISVWNG